MVSWKGAKATRLRPMVCSEVPRTELIPVPLSVATTTRLEGLAKGRETISELPTGHPRADSRW